MSSGFSAQSLFGTNGGGPSVFSPGFPSLQDRHKLKIKRTRQRVDAGEPRNTYSSIPNYTASSNLRGTAPAQQAVGPSSYHRFLMESQKFASPVGGLDLSSPGMQNALYPAEGLLFPPHFLAMPNGAPIFFGAQNGDTLGQTAGPPKMNTSEHGQDQPIDLKRNPSRTASASVSPSADDGIKKELEMDQTSRIESKQPVIFPVNPVEERSVSAKSDATAGGAFSRSNSADNSTPRSKRKQYQPQQLEPATLLHAEHNEDDRSELSASDGGIEGLGQFEGQDDDIRSNGTTPPLQHDEDDKGSDEEPLGPVRTSFPSAVPDVPRIDMDNSLMLKEVQAQLVYMQQQYVNLLKKGKMATTEETIKPKSDTVIGTKRRVPLDDIEDDSPELKDLSAALKKKLVQIVKGSVDRILVEYIETAQKNMTAEDLSMPSSKRARKSEPDKTENGLKSATVAQNLNLPPKDASHSPNAESVPGLKPLSHGPCPPSFKDLADWVPRPQPPFYINPSLYYNAAALSYANASNGFSPAASMAQSIFPTFGAPGRNAFFPGLPSLAHPPPATQASNTQRQNSGLPSGLGMPRDEAISLVLPKKKRSKVTDTRVTKLHSKPDPEGVTPNQQTPAFYHSPTMVPPHLLMSGRMFDGHGPSRDEDSPANSDAGFDCSGFESAYGLNTTLSPMHLRKAKLMFFYVRYPSSALLKAYFPDIMFNKNNTAQLVKWFSNFREFYYIQMEKYARQALAEGMRNPEEINVSAESEIYRVLNLHYNRNNHIAVPPTFPSVIQATLQEFFKAIQAARDAEPSWKKTIYKVIQRLDDPIPEYFKTPNFMEQLEG